MRWRGLVGRSQVAGDLVPCERQCLLPTCLAGQLPGACSPQAGGPRDGAQLYPLAAGARVSAGGTGDRREAPEPSPVTELRCGLSLALPPWVCEGDAGLQQRGWSSAVSVGVPRPAGAISLQASALLSLWAFSGAGDGTRASPAGQGATLQLR